MAFFLSCTQTPHFEQSLPLTDKGWIRSDIDDTPKLSFTVPINQIDCKYDVSLIIHHSKELQYDKLFTYLNIRYPDSQEKYLEKIIYLKSDSNTFLGTQNGADYQIIFPYMKQTSFNAKGDYLFEIGNLMSKYHTRGIKEIGLKITRHKNTK